MVATHLECPKNKKKKNGTNKNVYAHEKSKWRKKTTQQITLSLYHIAS